jgi:hypothetical protein
VTLLKPCLELEIHELSFRKTRLKYRFKLFFFSLKGDSLNNGFFVMLFGEVLLYKWVSGMSPIAKPLVVHFDHLNTSSGSVLKSILSEIICPNTFGAVCILKKSEFLWETLLHFNSPVGVYI